MVVQPSANLQPGIYNTGGKVTELHQLLKLQNIYHDKASEVQKEYESVAYLDCWRRHFFKAASEE